MYTNILLLLLLLLLLYMTYSVDFLVDTMQSVDKMLRKKRLNPDEKADLPFPDAEVWIFIQISTI